jgi:flagellar biosynthetic protein FliS
VSRNRTEVSYRRLAVEGASPIGLLVALIDQLISDLRQAATALHNNDIEVRCRELNHAALVVGQLESWVDRKNGGDNAELLLRFYSMIRAKMMEASIKKSAQVIEKLIEEIARVRTSWQKLDTVPVDHTHKPSEHDSPQAYAPLQPAAGMASERIPFSQTG